MTRQTKVTAATLFGLLVVSLVLGTALGSVDLPFLRTAEILVSALRTGGEIAGDWQRAVILHVRLPRVLLASLAGGGLAVAGAAMQGVFRNPMADPAVLGVSAGAAFGAVLALYLLPESASIYVVPLAAFVGGLGCAYLVYSLASARGRTSIATLLLAGIAIASIANALTSFVLSVALAEWEIGRHMIAWLMGGLEGRTWQHLFLAAPIVLGGSIWVSIYARELNALLTGEENALSVGVDVVRVRRTLIALSALVTAGTVAVLGIVGFVGLMVPHMVRLLVGPDHRRLLPISFLTGALFLLWADVGTRALPFAHLRLGVVTALAGGPFFLYLLLRHRARVGIA